MTAADRPEQKFLWLKALKDHLTTHILPISTSHGIDITQQTLQDSTIVALTSSSQSSRTNSTPNSVGAHGRLPLDSTIVTVERLNSFKESFHVCLHPQYGGQPVNDGDQLGKCSVILVAVLAISNAKDKGLRLKDSTGEIHCEVILPMQSRDCIVVLKEWNFIHSTLYGNYLEIETLVCVEEGHSNTLQRLMPGEHDSYLSVTEVQRHVKGGGLKGSFNVIGRLTAISEPVKNGPEFIVILRITHGYDESKYCHIITQSPELMHWPRVLKLFEIYAFTQLKSVIMNKDKEDEAMVLTSTSHSRVEHVTSELASQLYTTTAASPPSYSDSTRLQQVVDSTSPPRKKTRAEKAGHSPAMDSTITSGSSIKPDPVYPSSSNPDVLSYKGVITHCLLPEAGVYELDDRLILYLAHTNLSNNGRGLREGAEIEVSNTHLLKITNPLWKKMSGFFCCSLGRVEVIHFSKKSSSFKAYITQNKLAHMLSNFRALDVVWMCLAFLSLLQKLKRKREAFSVLTELCQMVGVMRIQQTVHSSFLQVPHRCQFLEPVDISRRPLVPTLKDVLQFAKEHTSSAMFCWRGSKEGAMGASNSTTAGPLLNVAVSATWSYGRIRSTEFSNPQVMIGTVSGNRCSGYLELSDATAALPLVACIPYSPMAGDQVSRHWLMDVGDGSTVALGEFTVIVERTEELEGCKDSCKFSFYVHSEDLKILQKGEKMKSQKKQEGTTSGVCKKPTSIPSSLYILINSKNALKPQGPTNTHCGFDAQALAHSNLEYLQGIPQPSSVRGVAVVFKTACWYSYIYNGCIYRLSCSKDSEEKLPSLEALLKEPCITVGDEVLVELIELPAIERCVHICGHILEIGELVSKLYLPKLHTTFTTPIDHQQSRGKEDLVSFRGAIMEHGYRIDCNTTHLTPWTDGLPLSTASTPPNTRSNNTRHIIALNIRGLRCPNTIMVYCTYKPHDPLPLGLLPGTVATFHNFLLKLSARLGNAYCVNCPSSSITVERFDGVETAAEMEVDHNKSGVPTPEMLCLPISNVYDMTQMLFRGHLSRALVSIKATITWVQHAFIQYQCQGCQCTMVDGRCRPTCIAKKAMLKTDARFLVQDGTGEAHLYVKDRVLPIALGMGDREWSDLLDLVYKVGQVTYTKSSMHQRERRTRDMTVREKAETAFLEALTRPSVVRTRIFYCQPFLSSSELGLGVIGRKSHRVHVRHDTEYVTLSLPRFQLRVLAIAPTDPLSLTHRLLALLEPS